MTDYYFIKGKIANILLFPLMQKLNL